MNRKVTNQHRIARSLSIGVVALLMGFTPVRAARAAEAYPQDKSLAETEKQDDHYTARLQRLDNNFRQINLVIRVIQEKLPSFLERLKSLDDPELQNTLDKLGKEHDALTKKFEQFEQEIDELKRTLELKQQEIPPQSIEQLGKELAEADKDKKRLDEELNRLNSGGCDKWEKFRDMRPVYVLIYKGRIVPIEEPYYRYRYGHVEEHGKDIPAVEKKRVREGELVRQAINAGGCLHKLLSNLDPDKEYINFKVCKDSIGAFHLAVEKVRGLKIPYSWKPDVDRTFVFTEGDPNDRGPKNQK